MKLVNAVQEGRARKVKNLTIVDGRGNGDSPCHVNPFALGKIGAHAARACMTLA